MTQTLIQYPLSWLTRSGPQGMLLLLLKTPKQKAPWVQMQWKRGCPCCTHQDTAEWRGGCERQKHFGKRKDKLTNWSNLPLGSGAMNRLLPDQVLFPGSVGRQLLLSFPSCSDLGEGRFPWIRCVRTVFTAAKCGSSGTFQTLNNSYDSDTCICLDLDATRGKAWYQLFILAATWAVNVRIIFSKGK